MGPNPAETEGGRDAGGTDDDTDGRTDGGACGGANDVVMDGGGRDDIDGIGIEGTAGGFNEVPGKASVCLDGGAGVVPALGIPGAEGGGTDGGTATFLIFPRP